MRKIAQIRQIHIESTLQAEKPWRYKRSLTGSKTLNIELKERKEMRLK